MWNCEAMWISFQRIREPCAVKISSAGHNLLPLHLDYLVVDDDDQWCVFIPVFSSAKHICLQLVG
jgi:hypothetical protein